MMLRKFHYAEWNAKNTAIINSSVVLFFIFTASLDILLLFVSPDKLQALYRYPKTRYVLTILFFMILLDCRYYLFKKDAIYLMEGKMNRNIKNNGWLLFIMTSSILIGSIIVGFLISQYIKSLGIIIG
jgi:hypothetical protein